MTQQTLTQFPIHDLESAPEGARSALEGAKKNFGFLPNLLGVFAESPAALKGYLGIAGAFGSSSLSPVEQQVVLLAASALNGCTYCVGAHSTLALGVKMPAEVLAALRSGEPLPDAKLQALATFTEQVVELRGWAQDALEPFFASGYTRQNVLEVILGVTQKTLSNYTNHLSDTPLDDVFAAQAWQKAE